FRASVSDAHMGRPILRALLLVLALLAGGARRRPSGSGDCPAPIVGLSTFPAIVCPGQPFTLRWAATDARARVTIEGIGNDLAPFGAMQIHDSRTSFNARGSLACVTGPIAHFEIASGGAAIRAAETTVAADRTTMLGIALDPGATWTITSTLGNAIAPSSGTGSTGVTYFA